MLLALPLLLAAPATGQNQKRYAVIFGTVWTADNRPAYGVPIKVCRAGEKKARWEAVSDHQGEFAVRVPPVAQEYEVWADIKLPKGKEPPKVKVQVSDPNVRNDVSLHLPD